MRKYYTRACNFYHGKFAKELIRSKKALPLNGNKYLAFDNVEILVGGNFAATLEPDIYELALMGL